MGAIGVVAVLQHVADDTRDVLYRRVQQRRIGQQTKALKTIATQNTLAAADGDTDACTHAEYRAVAGAKNAHGATVMGWVLWLAVFFALLAFMLFAHLVLGGMALMFFLFISFCGNMGTGKK